MLGSNKFHTVESAVFRDQYNVERIREDGSIDVAIFTGPSGKQMSIEYENFKNGTGYALPTPALADHAIRFVDEGKSVVLFRDKIAIAIIDVKEPGRETASIVTTAGITLSYRNTLALQIAVALGAEIPTASLIQ